MKLFLLLGTIVISPFTLAQEPAGLDKGVYAHFETNRGNFSIELFEDLVPKTVSNFIMLATGVQPWRHPVTGEVHENTPFYNGLIFHRIIEGFMIQGGDPSGTGAGGPGYQFEDEFHPSLRHNKEGIVSMANAGADTNGSQFFITLGPTSNLDNIHSIFGEVIDGMNVVRRIGSISVGPNDRPFPEVVIQNVAIQRILN